MSFIQVQNLTFYYDNSDDIIFQNLSFWMDTDWRLGLIGRNGTGKTTFLNLLTGKYEYRGKITSSVSFCYFPFPVTDKQEKTETILQSLSNGAPLWQLKKDLTQLEVRESILCQSFSTLSQGEQTKVLLAALFQRENAYLLIDEPTNHLDIQARKLVSSYLKTKQNYLLVSHDRTFLDNCIDHILYFTKDTAEVQRGNYTSWQRNKELQDAFELAENDKLKKEIKTLTASARQAADWSGKVEKTKKGTKNSGLRPDKGFIGHKAAKMMKRSKNITRRKETAIAQKETLLKNLDTADPLVLSPLTYHKQRLLSVSGLSIFYGENQVCKDISFTIEQGERVSLQGKNGSGKSSILKLLLGEKTAYSGEITLANGLILSYVPQDTSFLKGNLWDYTVENGICETQFFTILRKLAFSRKQFEKELSSFSEGQKKKVVLAASLCQKAHLYLWDEPLNFIDLPSRIQIEKLLNICHPTMLFVEHDSVFTENIATKKVSL